MIARLAQVVFVLSLLLVAFVTLSPIEFRPETGLPPSLERFGAFVWLGALLALGFPRHRPRAVLVLIAVAGGLEACQNLVPDRHGRWLDFDMKAAGALAGVGVVAAAWRVRDRRPFQNRG